MRRWEILGDFGEAGEKMTYVAPAASEDHHISTERLRDSMLSPIASSIGPMGFSEGPNYKKPGIKKLRGLIFLDLRN